jgi:hypothetical protein
LNSAKGASSRPRVLLLMRSQAAQITHAGDNFYISTHIRLRSGCSLASLKSRLGLGCRLGLHEFLPLGGVLAGVVLQLQQMLDVGLCTLAIKPGSRPRPFHRRICIPARPPEAAPQWHIKCQKPKAPRRVWYAIFGHPGPGRIFAGHPRRIPPPPPKTRRRRAPLQSTPPPPGPSSSGYSPSVSRRFLIEKLHCFDSFAVPGSCHFTQGGNLKFLSYSHWHEYY